MSLANPFNKDLTVTSALKTRFIIVAVLLGGLAAFSHAAEEKPYHRGPYLALATASSMVIVWRTDRAITPAVRIGDAVDKLLRIVNGAAIKARPADKGEGSLASAPAGAWQYEATVTGLSPARKYYYAVYDGDKLLAGADESYFFTTQPKPGSTEPFRFWVVGDSGTGDHHQADVHTAMRNLITKQNHPLDFYVHVGDMAYNSGKDEEFQRGFFEPYDLTLRNTVCWPTMGNHEGVTSSGKTGIGPYYDAYVVPTKAEAGGVASGTEAYYSFDHGNAHFICLNSHDLDRQPTGAMAQWLKADLEATKAAWLIAFWHHPPYSKGTHDSDKDNQLIEMRRHILPILESGGVDLVLTGHSHIYERSMLIDGAYGTPTVAENFVLDDGDGDPAGDGAYRKSEGIHANEGAVQVVAGHGGAGMGRIGTSPIMKRVFVEHGSVIVDVAGDTLTAIMLNSDGKQRDLFSMVKRGKVTPKRLEKPRQLGPYVSFESLAGVALAEAPLPGVTTKATVTIGKLPRDTETVGSTAKIEWNTAGTAWTFEPPKADIAISREKATQQAFTVSGRELFPLPTGKITYQTGTPEEEDKDSETGNKEGELAVKLNIAIPAYRRAALPAMTTAPVIDGVLTEQELAGLSKQGNFVAYRGTGAAKHPTEFYAGVRNNQLYLAVVAHEPEMAKLRNVDREFDGPLYSDDSIEIFVQREGTGPHYQFIVSAMGQRYDSRGTDTTWNGSWTTAVQRGADRWVSESLISLDMLGEPIKPGMTLRFNLVRNDQVHGEASQWSHTNRGGNHRPEYFGTLVLGEAK